jgi:outer membrane protein W
MSFISLSLFAQNKYEPGYIVKNNKETVKGYIQNGTEEDFSKQVNFKPDSLSPEQVFLPGDIISFGFGKDIYKTISFQNTSAEKRVWDTSFVKQLVTGKYDLYIFTRSEQHYYLIKSDTTTYFLYNSLISNNGELITRGNYVNTLNLLSIPCNKLASRYDRVGFSESEMSNFILALNKCISPETAVNYYTKPKPRTEVFVFAGGLPLGNQSQVTAEALLRISVPSLNRNTFFNIGLHYSSTLNSVTYRDLYYGVYSNTIMHKIYSVPITIQYDLATGRIRPYFYAGLGIAYLNENAKGPYNNDPPVKNNFGFSFTVGAGIEVRIVKRLFIRADYRYELVVQYPAIGIAYQFK